MIQQRNVILVLLLSFITCGIYGLFWQYSISNELKSEVPESNLNPGLDVLLSLLCFPYVYYWYYKASKAAYQAELNCGMRGNDNAILNILLLVFGLGIVSMALLQSQANDIARAKGL